MLLNQISIRSVGALGSLMVVAAASHAGQVRTETATESRAIEQGRRLLASRSARFVENKGQWNAEARFLAQSRSLDLWYTDHGLRYDQISPNGRRHQAVDMVFLGGGASRPVGVSRLNAEQQIFHGNLAVTGIHAYREVLKRGVLPGVDMRGYYDGGKPRYDLIVAPGTKPSSIALGFRGANGLSVAKGALKIGTNFDGIYNAKPVAYQVVAGKRIPVAAAWAVNQGTARFKVGTYDPRRPLVIDPLVYGTYFGGISGPDEVRAAISDYYNGTSHGLVIVGSSSAPDFPATSKPFTDTLNPEGTDAFITRIIPNPVSGGFPGTLTDFSVLIGGQGTDIAQYVKQDGLNGDIFFAGTTISGPNMINGAYNTFPSALDNSGHRQVIGTDSPSAANYFVGRFTHNSDGSLSFGSDGTYGGRYTTVFGTGIPASSVEGAYMTGFDINPYNPALAGEATGFVQMAISGVTSLSLPTALIGTSQTAGDGYAHPHPATSINNAILNGGQNRAGFLLRFGIDDSGFSAPQNAYYVNSASSQYVLGTRASELRGVALDAFGKAYVVGTVYTGTPQNVDTSQSPSTFYTTPNAISNVNGTTVLGRILRGTDVFVRIYNTYNRHLGAADNIVFSGLIGGNGDDEAGGVAMSLSIYNNLTEEAIPIYTGSAIALDANDNIYFTGTTLASTNFPFTAKAFATFTPPPGNEGGQSDIFVARLSADGSTLNYSTALGTNAQATTLTYGPAQFTSAMPAGVAVDSQGYVYVTGNLRPYSIIWPTTYTPPAVFEPSSSTQSTIPVGSAANTIQTTYAEPSAGPYPSTEGFLMVLDPTFHSLQFATYIGGSLDDLVYAPSFDSSGDVILSGWTDGGRSYLPPNKMPPAYFDQTGSLPGLISGDAFKTVPDTDYGGLTISNFGYNSQRNYPSGVAPDQQSIGITVGRDGFASTISAVPPPAAPTVALTFNPSAVAPFASSTGTITITPAQITATTVTVTGPTLTGLVSSDLTVSGLTATGTANTYTTVIPAGSTSATFTVKSNTVTAAGGTAAFTATVPSGSSTSTATGTLTFSGEGLGFTLNPNSVSGLSGTTTVTGTLSLTSPAPEAITTKVTVPNTAENQKVFPAATVDSANSTLLDVATPSFAAGSTSATFNITVGGPDSAQVVSLTAITTTSNVDTLTSSATLTVTPVTLLSITASPKTVSGNSGLAQVKFTVTFVGQPSVGDALSVVYSLPRALSTTAQMVASTPTAGSVPGQYVYTFVVTANRVTLSQDVTVTATYKSSSASTIVTVTR